MQAFRLLGAVVAGLILVALLGALLFVLITLQHNWGKTNTVVLHNESDRTLTHVVVMLAREQHALDPVPAMTMGTLEVSAGGEGAVAVSFRIGETAYSCTGDYITGGVSSYTEVRVASDMTLSRKFYYPELSESGPYYGCAALSPDQPATAP